MHACKIIRNVICLLYLLMCNCPNDPVCLPEQSEKKVCIIISKAICNSCCNSRKHISLPLHVFYSSILHQNIRTMKMVRIMLLSHYIFFGLLLMSRTRRLNESVRFTLFEMCLIMLISVSFVLYCLFNQIFISTTY